VLIPVRDLRRFWGLNPATVLHVGAHNGEELDDYEAHGWGRTSTIWVEADQARASALRDRLSDRSNHTVLCAVAWDKAGETIEFHELTNSQASSALAPAEIFTVYSDMSEVTVVKRITETLDEMLANLHVGNVDLVNLDIQGAELQALRGLGHRLREVQAIYSEINLRQLYAGGALVDELDRWLRDQGFRMVDRKLESKQAGWGDALWIRTDLLPRAPQVRRSARILQTLLPLAVYRLRLLLHTLRVAVGGVVRGRR